MLQVKMAFVPVNLLVHIRLDNIIQSNSDGQRDTGRSNNQLIELVFVLKPTCWN